ncbi:MAG: hypothetical protein JWL90_1359 [Chthoniobacteraceae bacterium]|nr:hypothetical protein [Chthoniobacteraceae bacterium]
MADQAKITSIDALEAFRASLIIFLTRAHGSVDSVGDEVRRTRVWLQNDQRIHWENQIRRWRRQLDQATQDLMSARLSGLRDSTSAQEMAVVKCKRGLAESEEKLRSVKIWNRDFDHYMSPLLKRMEGLRQFLDYDMPKALAYLVQAQHTLDAYAETKLSGSVAPAPPLE